MVSKGKTFEHTFDAVGECPILLYITSWHGGHHNCHIILYCKYPSTWFVLNYPRYFRYKEEARRRQQLEILYGRLFVILKNSFYPLEIIPVSIL